MPHHPYSPFSSHRASLQSNIQQNSFPLFLFSSIISALHCVADCYHNNNQTKITTAHSTQNVPNHYLQPVFQFSQSLSLLWNDVFKAKTIYTNQIVKYIISTYVSLSTIHQPSLLRSLSTVTRTKSVFQLLQMYVVSILRSNELVFDNETQIVCLKPTSSSLEVKSNYINNPTQLQYTTPQLTRSTRSSMNNVPSSKVKSPHPIISMSETILNLFTIDQQTGKTLDKLLSTFHQIISPLGVDLSQLCPAQGQLSCFLKSTKQFPTTMTPSGFDIEKRYNLLTSQFPPEAMNYLYYNNSIDLSSNIQYYPNHDRFNFNSYLLEPVSTLQATAGTVVSTSTIPATQDTLSTTSSASLSLPHPSFESSGRSSRRNPQLSSDPTPLSSTTVATTKTQSNFSSPNSSFYSIPPNTNPHDGSHNYIPNSDFNNQPQLQSWSVERLVDKLSDLSHLTDLKLSLQDQTGIQFDTLLLETPLILTYDSIKPNTNRNINSVSHKAEAENSNQSKNRTINDYYDNSSSSTDDDVDTQHLFSIQKKKTSLKSQQQSKNFNHVAHSRPIFNHITRQYESDQSPINNQSKAKNSNFTKHDWFDLPIDSLLDPAFMFNYHHSQFSHPLDSSSSSFNLNTSKNDQHPNDHNIPYNYTNVISPIPINAQVDIININQSSNNSFNHHSTNHHQHDDDSNNNGYYQQQQYQTNQLTTKTPSTTLSILYDNSSKPQPYFHNNNSSFRNLSPQQRQHHQHQPKKQEHLHHPNDVTNNNTSFSTLSQPFRSSAQPQYQPTNPPSINHYTHSTMNTQFSSYQVPQRDLSFQ
jgi:hypothetical protein